MYELVKVLEEKCLFTEDDISSEVTPEGLHMYFIESDGTTLPNGLPCVVGLSVEKPDNFFGTILSKEEFDEGELEDEDFKYFAEEMTLEEYLELFEVTVETV